MRDLYYGNPANFLIETELRRRLFPNAPVERRREWKKVRAEERRMSLPVAALACELDKNLKTFGYSLDVLPERSSPRLVFPRSRCGVPADGRICPNARSGFHLPIAPIRSRVAIGKKAHVGMNISSRLGFPVIRTRVLLTARSPLRYFGSLRPPSVEVSFKSSHSIIDIWGNIKRNLESAFIRVKSYHFLTNILFLVLFPNFAKKWVKFLNIYIYWDTDF